MEIKDIINNVNVWGIEESIRGAKFPMSVDTKETLYIIEDFKYWNSYGDFLDRFVDYQTNYGKNKGSNNKNSCYFCGSDIHVRLYKKASKYYCSKCCHQLDRYGETFETLPQFILEDNHVRVITKGEKKSSSQFIISYESLPFVFNFKEKIKCGTNGYINELHRKIYENKFGQIPKNMIIDHINQDIRDNRISNLRLATHIEVESDPTQHYEENNHNLNKIVKDYKCVKTLAMTKKGCGEDNWLNGIIVQFDLTFTIKAWTEAERYHFLDFVSSQSTMHRITRFDLDKAYVEYVDQRIVEIMKEKVSQYNESQDKEKYLEILYNNPCGMKLTARMTTNYRQLKTIYSQRKTHKLPEWRIFCSWIETLPNSEFICGEKK